MMEPLKCGPCKKCIKKTEDMIGHSFPKEKYSEVQETRERESKVSKVTTRSSTLREPVKHVGGIYTEAELIQMQREYFILRQVMEWCKNDSRPDYKEMTTQCPELRHYWHLWSSLLLINGILYKNYYKMKLHISFK
jgi:hypothetical protein